MKYHILYNPAAGCGKGKEESQFLDALYDGEICRRDIREIKDYAEFLSPLGENDTIILCGGDGTINRFVNATDGIEIKCEILYYAIGTGNDFLRDIGKTTECNPFSIKKYINDLPTVEINGKTYRFLNNVGFGIDGYCCEVGDKLKKTSDKPVNYTSIAIKGLLFHYKPTAATVTIDGEQFRYEKVWIAPTMKGRYYGGGMMPTPAQDRTDPSGYLSLMIMHGSGKLKTLMVFPSLFKGEHIKHSDMVAIHTGQEISVTFDRPAAVQIDGETILGVTSYRACAKMPMTVIQ
ncbi:MAG: diacylglycerol kinase family protein [Clostridia bacterium]|nr:diacylglycerol kinase family protein [Clostridia bacterium]